MSAGNRLSSVFGYWWHTCLGKGVPARSLVLSYRQTSAPTKPGAKMFMVWAQVSVQRPHLDVLQLSGRLAGDVKESPNGNPTRDLQMAADRTRPHTLCGPVVSSLLSFAARC